MAIATIHNLSEFVEKSFVATSNLKETGSGAQLRVALFEKLTNFR